VLASGALLLTSLPTELTALGFQEGVHFAVTLPEEIIVGPKVSERRDGARGDCGQGARSSSDRTYLRPASRTTLAPFAAGGLNKWHQRGLGPNPVRDWLRLIFTRRTGWSGVRPLSFVISLGAVFLKQFEDFRWFLAPGLNRGSPVSSGVALAISTVCVAPVGLG